MKGGCARAAQNRKTPPAFLLESHKDDLVHLLSLLNPITAINRKSQQEGCNQVDVLIVLYKLRVTVLDVNKPFRDYRSTLENQIDIKPEDLSPLVSFSRTVLFECFNKNFFKRYTNAYISKNSYVFKMQLALHPTFKDLDASLGKIVRVCSSDQVESEIKNIQQDQAKSHEGN